jgi:hypothetical protein
VLIRKILLQLIVLELIFNNINAQEIGIAEWRVHLPYRQTISLDFAGSLVYCATPYGIFYFDKEDNTINQITKINGLSDVNISKIRYSEQYKALIIVYTNANIDLIYEKSIINISDIKRKTILGNKTINNITIYGNYAYLSCGFGIVVLDILQNEIKDTYYIGQNGSSMNVLDVACDGVYIYAATESGIYKASYTNPNLANYANWSKDTSMSNPNGKYNVITIFQNKLFANLSVSGYSKDTLYVNDGNAWAIFDSTRFDDVFSIRVVNNKMLVSYNYKVLVYNSDIQILEDLWTYNPDSPEPSEALIDGDSYYWVADRTKGLVRYKDWNAFKITPDGPATNNAFAMDIAGSDLYVAAGSVNSAWGNVWNYSGVYSFIGGTWHTLKDYNTAFDTIYDIIDIAVDPSNSNHVFAASLGVGLVEIKNGYVVNVYDETNSPLEHPYSFYRWLGIGGLAFDDNNNIWAVNSISNNLLKMRTPDGSWYSFSTLPYISQAHGGAMMIDQHGQKWILLRNAVGLLVFNEKGTWSTSNDDVIKVLTTSVGNGSLPSNAVYCMAEDLDGKVWIGTDKGVAVFYNPENISDGGNFDAQQITIMQDGTAQHLLEFERVTSMAVDGSNKKWFGTEKAGVFLMSEDGQEEILHFTEENSPLLSNTITSIAIDENTGEVFFGTANGLISFKWYATKGGETFTNVYAYPNPVRGDFNGTIGIKGLVKDATVKITDVSGTLVYETKSEGGQAVWNGKNFKGDLVGSGVYFVFCSNEDCTEKLVTKIMVIR